MSRFAYSVVTVAAVGFIAGMAYLCLSDLGDAQDGEKVVAATPKRAAEKSPAAGDAVKPPQENRPDASKKATDGNGAKKWVKRARRRPVGDDVFDDPLYPYSKEDKSIAKELQGVLDGLEDLDLVDARTGNPLSEADLDRQKKRNVELAMSAAAKAAASQNPSVRLRAVDAYAWIGDSALPSLTPLMVDKDESVAETAVGAVEHVLMGVDDAQFKFEAGLSYIKAFPDNANALNMLEGIVSGAAMELVGVSESDPASARQKVIQALADLAGGDDGPSAERARAMYATVTGESWEGVEAAERWLQSEAENDPPQLDESDDPVGPEAAEQAEQEPVEEPESVPEGV